MSNRFNRSEEVLCELLYDGWEEIRNFINERMLEEFEYWKWEEVLEMVKRMGEVDNVGLMLRERGNKEE